MPYKNPDDRRAQQRRWIAVKRAKAKAQAYKEKTIIYTEGETNV